MIRVGLSNTRFAYIGNSTVTKISLGINETFFSYDPDALAHIEAVEAADGAFLEPEVKKMLNTYVLGLKNSESPNAGVSNWEAIKVHCCIPIARSLAGFLVPMKGAAPTNVNFVSGDYSRGVSLDSQVGKYIRLPFTLQDTAVDNISTSAYCVSAPTNEGIFGIIGAGNVTSEGNVRIGINANPNMLIRNRNTNVHTGAGKGNATGFIGTSRHIPSAFVSRYTGENYTSNLSATAAIEATYFNFYSINGDNGSPGSGGRYVLALAGEAIDLATVDAAQSQLISNLQSFLS